MEFASPKRGNRLTIFRANNSCWRSKRVDRSFFMLRHIWVGVSGAIYSTSRIEIPPENSRAMQDHAAPLGT
jgi:hypothetical protein